MLLSILSNLIALYSLVAMPVISNFTIDASHWPETGEVKLLKNNYFLPAPYRKDNNSLGMAITAKSAIVVDKKSNAVLWQKNPSQARSIASITKLLTALVFLEHNPGWDNVVTMRQSDYREGGRLRLFTGEQITVKDLFNLSLVASLNNAVTALARSTGLTEAEFVAAMNKKAQALSMANSVFLEPTGLEPGNLSTAGDVIKLAAAAFANQEIKIATAQEEYSYSIINKARKETLKNTDKLLTSYLNVLAGKTGYLDEAGYCLVSEVKSLSGQEIIIAVLGSNTEADRFQDLKALAQWTFDNYVWE